MTITNLGLNGVSNNYGTYMNPAASLNTALTNSSIFGNNLQGNITNYENDLFMPDFLKLNSSTYAPVQTTQNSQTAEAQTQTPMQMQTQANTNPNQKTDYAQQQTYTQTPSFQGQNQDNQTQCTQQDINNYIAQQQLQKTDIQEKPSLGLRKKGLFAGLVAPVATGLYKAFKNGSPLSGALNKSTLIKCPIYAVLGYLAGVLIENLFNKKTEQAA